MEVLEDFHFKSGEDPLEVFKSVSKQAILLTPLLMMIWLAVGFYNWAS